MSLIPSADRLIDSTSQIRDQGVHRLREDAVLDANETVADKGHLRYNPGTSSTPALIEAPLNIHIRDMRHHTRVLHIPTTVQGLNQP